MALLNKSKAAANSATSTVVVEASAPRPRPEVARPFPATQAALIPPDSDEEVDDEDVDMKDLLSDSADNEEVDGEAEKDAEDNASRACDAEGQGPSP